MHNAQENNTLRYKLVNVCTTSPFEYGMVWRCATMSPSEAAALNAKLVLEQWLPCDGSQGEY